MMKLIATFVCFAVAAFADVVTMYEGEYADVVFCKKDDGSLVVDIYTERLHITSVRADEEHYAHYLALFGSPIVMEKYAECKPRSFEAIKTRIDTSWVPRWESNDPFSGLIVRKKDTEKAIGHVILGYGDVPGESEMAYLFIPEEWRKGYGSESVMAIIHDYVPALIKEGYLVEGALLRKVTATTREDNAPSYKIVEKAGLMLDRIEEKFGGNRRFYSLEVGP